jgi:hypothetical protein
MTEENQQPPTTPLYCALLRPEGFRFGEGPGGFGLKFSTSERFNRVLPPTASVVKRPFFTKLPIACRVTRRISAASACDTHWTGSKLLLAEFLPSIDIVNRSPVYFLASALSVYEAQVLPRKRDALVR